MLEEFVDMDIHEEDKGKKLMLHPSVLRDKDEEWEMESTPQYKEYLERLRKLIDACRDAYSAYRAIVRDKLFL